MGALALFTSRFTMMSPQEMEMKKNWVIDNCICKSCPSYVECGEKAGFCFPSIGKSKCIKEEESCICAKCPVYEKMDLGHFFFCTRGSEKEQSGM